MLPANGASVSRRPCEANNGTHSIEIVMTRSGGAIISESEGVMTGVGGSRGRIDFAHAIHVEI